ncbi:MAG: glycoside hydrolase family 3 C-terminal domain-containing protein, partial [Melioribacteraceae bacterium]|nr:glycoside hydrolase family 3 C-terminal domain-containing protein [Melioribacteraceae bacterium]
MRNFTFTKFLIILFVTTSLFAQNETYKDPTKPITERVEDLLGRMTLAEKIGQMTQAEHKALGTLNDIKDYRLGSLLSGGGSGPDFNTAVGWADMYDSYQSVAIQSRLGIPIIYGVDAVHGHNNVKGAVIFPHNIGLGATRNPDLIREVSRITAIEVAGTGIDWTFAPCIAVPRDIRWGRTYEGFGETPELQVMMSSPAVEGLQGDTLSDPESVLACAKHYIGDGGTTNGTDQGNTELDEETLRAIHLPGYIEAINSGVGTIMASYSSWNGEKLHGQKYLLTDVLKTELGFKGFVISDWAGIDQLPGDYVADVEQSINAGVDMVMVPNNYKDFITILTNLVNTNKVSQDRIDDAVRRILYQKFALGLFETPLTDRSLTSLIGSASHRTVGRQAVRESMVLLTKKDGVLPLNKSGQKILVAGSHADNMGFQCGGWSIYWQGGDGDITPGTTILEGIQELKTSSEIVYSIDATTGRDADVAVVAIGEEPYAEGGGDSRDLSLDESDIKLIKNLKADGLKVVVILVSGRPLIIDSILPFADAIFAAWLPGTEGAGIADILFGDYQPTGKSPNTWPKTMEQIPMNFGDADYDPLFAYGYGINSVDNWATGTAPLFYGGNISDDGKFLRISFSRKMKASGINSNEFNIRINGLSSAVQSIVNEPGDETILDFYLSQDLASSDIVTIEYSGTSLQAADGAGVEAFGPFNIYNSINKGSQFITIPTKIQAEDYADMSGIETEQTADVGAGDNVGWTDAGDWLSYNITVPKTGNYIMKFRIASESNEGDISILIDESEIATKTFPVTGGWQNWETVTEGVFLNEGNQVLKILITDGGFNLNWIEFVEIITTVSDNSTPNEFVLLQN